MLPQQPFGRSKPRAGRKHWEAFEKYVAFQTRQGSIKTFDECLH